MITRIPVILTRFISKHGVTVGSPMSCRSHMQHLLNEVSTVSALRRSKCRAESTDKELSLIGDIWKNGLLPKLFNQIVE